MEPAAIRAALDGAHPLDGGGRLPLGRRPQVRLHNQGVGRFTKLGFPFPELTAHFVGGLEIVGGILLIAGFLTRIIAIPFVIEMVVAMLSTKIAIYLGTSPLPLPPSPPQIGIWAVLHEVRSEYAQLMSVLFLLAVGPGPWSVDALIARARVRTLVPVPRRNAA